ncbi:TPA: hypothetical protein IAC10_13150 [Candidatus Scatousia excrementigallinarum]|uniref:Uncharacterized protein n=1 Tax=Candidatus Scatousia excrementigallinarum TaxID=2840935 RepID=A0A9D1F1A4_9BACT|nr:hypothetical protein [Candidatus Scatousia excrementigallinarum]
MNDINKTMNYESIIPVTFFGGDDELISEVTFHKENNDPKITAVESKKLDLPKLQGPARPANTKTIPKSGK